MDNYTPIACHLHDIYEIAILRGQTLSLTWLEGGVAGGVQRQDKVQPRDLTTADGAEWLLADGPGGERLQLRLDWITRAETVGNW